MVGAVRRVEAERFPGARRTHLGPGSCCRNGGGSGDDGDGDVGFRTARTHTHTAKSVRVGFVLIFGPPRERHIEKCDWKLSVVWFGPHPNWLAGGM